MNGGFNASDALTPPETPPAAAQLKEALQQRPKRLSIIADDEEEEGEVEEDENEEDTVEMEEVSHGMGKKNGTLNGIDSAFNGHANDGDVTVEAELQLLSVSTDGKDEKVIEQ